MDFSVGSYHSRSWWPLVKLMSSLWKMAAHWKGAAALDGLVYLCSGRETAVRTVLCLAGGAMAELAV